MNGEPYKVYVVVDRVFGERLVALEARVPVWIVNTPENRAVAERIWRARPAESHLHGVTIFNDFDDRSPEDLLLGELDTIDLHHGSWSADPPYGIVEVLGATPTARVRTALRARGFTHFEIRPNGFAAFRHSLNPGRP
jgi:hypothetical protein